MISVPSESAKCSVLIFALLCSTMCRAAAHPYDCRLVTAAAHSTAGKQSQHGGYSTLLCFYKVSSFYKHPANLSHTNWNAIERARFSSQNETENSLFGDSEVKIWECHILILVLSTANFILIRSLSLSLNSSAASSLISRGWMELMIIFTLYSKPNITRLINSLFQFS